MLCLFKSRAARILLVEDERLVGFELRCRICLEAVTLLAAGAVVCPPWGLSSEEAGRTHGHARPKRRAMAEPTFGLAPTMTMQMRSARSFLRCPLR
jgi:hypothetical protein